jgi:hypothetical protein
MIGVLRQELKWLALGFGIPFLLVVVFDLATRRSPLSLGRRLLTLEDVCPYGSCAIVAILGVSHRSPVRRRRRQVS